MKEVDWDGVASDLAGIAKRWHAALGIETRFPREHAE
jgi:hypothetical protein